MSLTTVVLKFCKQFSKTRNHVWIRFRKLWTRTWTYLHKFDWNPTRFTEFSWTRTWTLTHKFSGSYPTQSKTLKGKLGLKPNAFMTKAEKNKIQVLFHRYFNLQSVMKSRQQFPMPRSTLSQKIETETWILRMSLKNWNLKKVFF